MRHRHSSTATAVSSRPPKAGSRRSQPVRAHIRLAGLILALGWILVPQPAAADFRLCNNTSSRVGISVGYKENDGWTTEG